jgi:hypothetical protein
VSLILQQLLGVLQAFWSKLRFDILPVNRGAVAEICPDPKFRKREN